MRLTVLKYDLRQIRHDPMLILSTVAPILIWGILKYGYPFLATMTATQWGIDIEPYFMHSAVGLLTLIPMLFGIIYGFMMLDERDAGIITAISVTPLGKSGYLQMRMIFPVTEGRLTERLSTKRPGQCRPHFGALLLKPFAEPRLSTCQGLSSSAVPVLHAAL